MNSTAKSDDNNNNKKVMGRGPGTMSQKKRKLLISLATRRSIAQFGLILDEVFQVLVTFFNAGLRLVCGVVITALARQVVDVTGGNLDNAQLGHFAHLILNVKSELRDFQRLEIRT